MHSSARALARSVNAATRNSKASVSAVRHTAVVSDVKGKQKQVQCDPHEAWTDGNHFQGGPGGRLEAERALTAEGALTTPASKSSTQCSSRSRLFCSSIASHDALRSITLPYTSSDRTHRSLLRSSTQTIFSPSSPLRRASPSAPPPWTSTSPPLPTSSTQLRRDVHTTALPRSISSRIPLRFNSSQDQASITIRTSTSLLPSTISTRALHSTPLHRNASFGPATSSHILLRFNSFPTQASMTIRTSTSLLSSPISTRALHSTPRHRNVSSRPTTSGSPTSSPSPPQSALPPPFTGLGTTQLSPDIMLRCTIFDSSGSATSTSGVFKKSRLCSEHGLEPRDLRKIDSRVPNLVPTILARRGGILVNILHIRAMIKADKVLLFDSYGSTDSQLHSAFVYNLQHNLKGGHLGGQGGLAYEFRALESILVSVLDALRIELGVVRGWTSGVLEELDDDVDREKLRTLLQVSRKLNAFLSRAKAVKGAVVEVLENEEDMQLMYLSHPPPSPSPSPPASSSGASSVYSPTEMDELELLLESFDKQVEEVVAETAQLSSDISNTQEVVELILDNNRNKLLALDLKTSIVTMGISAGTLWAGLFGMNLKSGLEEGDYAFLTISGIAMVAVAITGGLGLRRLERLRRVGLGMGGKKRKDKQRAGWLGKWKGKKVEEGQHGGPTYAMLSGYNTASMAMEQTHPHFPHFDAVGGESGVGLGMGLGSKWDPPSSSSAASKGGLESNGDGSAPSSRGVGAGEKGKKRKGKP